jgi:citramalate synthase
MLDCEHFFDGYKANPDYALACARAAFDAGARWIVLCDTNGGTLPQEIAAIVAEVAKVVPGDNLGIHAHDDCGCAVANSLAAVEAGVRQVQGTLNGLGERCGNANLVTLIGALKLKDRYRERFSLGVDDRQLAELTHVSRALDEMLNRAPNRHAPFVGASAFATKAGIHASAVLKDPRTYEHVPPEATGNLRKVLISDQGGKSNLVAELERIGVTLGRDDPRLTRVLEEVKDKEAQGYAFEGADASFFLLAKRIMGEVPTYFEIERFAVNVERRHNALGELVTFSEAIVKVKVGDEVLISAAEGASGPGERARRRAAQGSRPLSVADRGLAPGRLQGPDLPGRHGCRHPRPDRIRRRDRRALDHGGRQRQHHRRLVPGAGGLDHLQAGEGRRDGLSRRGRPAASVMVGLVPTIHVFVDRMLCSRLLDLETALRPPHSRSAQGRA